MLQKINNENDTDSDESSCSPSSSNAKLLSATTTSTITKDHHQESFPKTTQHFIDVDTDTRVSKSFTPPSSQDEILPSYKLQEYYMKESEEESEYFRRWFSQIMLGKKQSKSSISGILESFSRKQEKTTREHRNEICNYVERVANLESELKIARMSIES